MFKFKRSGRDAGMTLPEVLISVMVTGLLVAALAAASTVVLRQNDNVDGRLNNSRSEQNVGLWMPSDLASAEAVDTLPGATPCGSQCPPGINVGGSNALMLTWTGSIPGATAPIPTRTTVSYRYVLVGDEYQVIRVQCVSVNSAAPTCSQVVMLRNAEPPPPGTSFIAGTDSPFWVMLVTLAIDPAAPDDGSEVVIPDDPTYYVKNGRRVTVTINGGGDVSGAGGGQDQITLSAGGVNRETDLSTTNLSATPTFSATRSRCGGNFGLIVDTSGSIGDSNMTSVRTGITNFINAFAGTPVKLQVVRFSTTATTLGAGSGWSRYFDMLVEADVSELLSLVPTLQSTGGTNYEDGMFRMFRNSDGSVQQVLPSTLIFFTDGIPTYSRLNSTSATSPAVADFADSGLPAGTGGSYSQLAWNRANRIIRQFEVDMEKIIGVYVGTDVNGSSTWLTQGAGYHYVNFVRGYYQTWDRGYHLENFQRGYHSSWDRGYHYENLQRGYHYEYQRATSGVVYERFRSSSWNNTVQWSSGSNQYSDKNTNNTESDNYRARVSGTPGTWVPITTVNGKSPQTLFEQSNQGGPTTDSDTDGFRRVKVYSAPYDLYETTTSAQFTAGNPSLPTISAGYTATVANTAPYTYWSATTQSAYNSGNTTADASDGWRINTLYSSPYSSWETTTEALYNTNNTTADNSDGWTAATTYTAPYTLWASATQSAYNSGNTTPDALDGWRVNNIYAAPYSLWESTTEALYLANNTSSGTSDGWNATKVYSEPYTAHENATSSSRQNRAILKDLISPSGPVPAIPAGGPYTNADQATYYELPNWNQFAGAMTTMALAECGGTVTLQTKVGATNAGDPFTYQNSVDLSTATTSAQFRSGTFDFDLSGGTSKTVTITPLVTSNLSRYHHVGWTCKAAGADYPFVATPIDGGWTKITLTVSPNKAVSCVNQVTVS